MWIMTRPVAVDLLGLEMLPALTGRRDRTIAGISAGGFNGRIITGSVRRE
jgi:hypothetical protein